MTATIPSSTTAAKGAQVRRAAAPIPTARIVNVELRKMFDTRSGFWLLVGIGVLSVIATGAVIVVAPDSAITYRRFVTAVDLPMSVILPMIAILAVTSEWSQRTGLTTFTLVPSRGRVIGAKGIATALVGVASMALALAAGAIGNLVGSALADVEPVWDMPLSSVPQIVLGNLIGMSIGFTLGVVLRSSAAAIVGFFTLSFVLAGVLQLLALAQQWFLDAQPWLDWNYTQEKLFDGATNTGQEWAMLGSTTTIWILVPLAIGLLLLRRSDVK